LADEEVHFGIDVQLGFVRRSMVVQCLKVEDMAHVRGDLLLL